MAKDYIIIIGAAKCGTTTLASWLNKLPDSVLAKQKETLYFTDFANRKWSGPGANFANKASKSLEDFEDEFSANPKALLRIEASTDNMCCPAAAENIARFSERPEVNNLWVVAMIRDPISRIVSEFEHTLRLGWQSSTLLKSLLAENERISNGFHPLFWHIARSRYFTQLSRYRELFGEHLHIFDFHKIGELEERARLLRLIGRDHDTIDINLDHKNQRRVVGRPGVVPYLKERNLQGLGRALVPKSQRPLVRRMLTGPSEDRYAPTDKETTFIFNALAEEIAHCIDAPCIPTESWSTTLRLAGK